jgi:hypothetical protein
LTPPLLLSPFFDNQHRHRHLFRERRRTIRHIFSFDTANMIVIFADLYFGPPSSLSTLLTETIILVTVTVVFFGTFFPKQHYGHQRLS